MKSVQSMELYYFSGTGNSLFVAKAVARRLGAVLIPIPSVSGKPVMHAAAGTIGIIFPSYLAALCGVPLIVERFVQKLADIGSKTVFAVCTCGGYESVNALPPLAKLGRIVRKAGGRLAAAFSVRLPMNNLDYGHIPVPINTDHGAMYHKSAARIDEICRRIASGKHTKYRLIKSVFLTLMSPLFRLMREPILASLKEKAHAPRDSRLSFRGLIPLTDKSIELYREKCNGCGTCARICPASNIKLVNNLPVFRHHCEMCFACDEWCPRGAIRHWSRAPGVKYRHPDVKLKDMLAAKGR